jgi:hypothetical protein
MRWDEGGTGKIAGFYAGLEYGLKCEDLEKVQQIGCADEAKTLAMRPNFDTSARTPSKARDLSLSTANIEPLSLMYNSSLTLPIISYV